ncbi:flavin reductase family protein [uncultured Enterovirga sp.]|uniref:flavin reductase family protein n=1 Tax=uncultured Enterovirga sp. TaxID=2026352 RepID=UPI0035CBB7DB
MPVSLSFADLAPRDRYKLLVATVVPRPIALVTTVDRDGVVNAAPFSFFNVFSEDPAIVVLGLQHKEERALKDTTRNIAETGTFVINLVDEALAEAMNICAIDFPPGVSEVESAGLTLRAGTEVAVPHILEAPFALECRRTVGLSFGPEREIVLGEVVHFHARDGLLDETTLRVSEEAYRPVGRLFANAYSRQSDRFDMVKESHADWEARQAKP